MASREVEPMDVAAKAPAGPPGGSEEPDRKDFTAAAAGGTMDTATLLKEHHAVPVSIKGAAVLQAMEARELGGGGGGGGSEVLASKESPLPASLAAKVQAAAATTGVFETQSAEEYAKVKAAEEVAATSGLYETQGERRERQQEEAADYAEIWPHKEDVAQLESMVAAAPGGVLEGVRLERGGDIAKLHSAADKGTSCVVHKKVAELLIKATTERPKEIKDRAAQRLAQEEAGIEGAPRTGEAMEVLSGSPPAVFVGDTAGAAARIGEEESQGAGEKGGMQGMEGMEQGQPRVT